MIIGIENMQKLGKDNMELAMQSFGAMTKGLQAISAEVADYSKKSVEQSGSAMEKVVSAKSLDKAFEAQSEFAKSSYEELVGEMTKLSEMYADLAKDVYKPFEGVMPKSGS
ncbi:phasin family protein [Flexibacterium corallicola]|uniref:phasin family protein n=1 Tax=Flexibacterium corallicola TaxID=3037259 RepID=UPI00286EF79C|nr:phasin family protein [Pseudovibrio sp. M1P-2-3]